MRPRISLRGNAVLSVLILLITGACNGFGKPDAPIELELSFQSIPMLNQPTEVDLTVTPRQDAPMASIRFIIPAEGFSVLSGPTEIEDTIPRDKTRVYAVMLLPISMGKQKLSASVTCRSGTFVFGKTAHLYALLSADSVQVSKSDLWETPFSTEMTMEEGIATAGEESAAPKSPTAAVPGPGQIVVYGHMYYRDKDGVDQPYKNARVEIWDSNVTADSKLATIYTDNTGYYESNPISNSDPGGGGRDIYVIVFTTDDYSVRVTDFSGNLFSSRSSTHNDVSDGYVDMSGISVTDANTRMSCYIYDKIANDAFDFLVSNVGWMNHYNLQVRWSPTSTTGTYYSFGGTIDLLAGDRWDSDVILHEFGHFVMYKIYGGAYPPTPNCHPHQWGFHSSLGCAWSEGWATFLQGAIQNDQYYDDTEDQIVHIDMEPPIPAADHAMDEGAVAASLWDVLDANAEAWDSINLGIHGIWAIASGNHPADAVGFFNDWQLSANGYNSQVASIFAHHGIIADALTITAAPSGTPNPVASGGAASLSVSATDMQGHALSYSWSASCPSLSNNGNYNDSNLQNPTWNAPSNATGSQQQCTMQVAVNDGHGLSQTVFYSQGVFAESMSGNTSENILLGTGAVAVSGTTGSNNTTHAGSATLTVNSGVDPYGTAVFSFRQNGVTITEAGVPASPPTNRALVFIDYRAHVLALPGQSNSGYVDINTGVAVVNTSSSAATVVYTLRDLSGNTLTIGNGTIAANTHFAKFINQLVAVAPNFNLPSNFQTATQFGTLEISSNQPLSVLALRGTNNQRNDFLITTTPVADLNQSLSYSNVYFPQFADGDGYSTSLILINTSSQTERGILQILNNGGSPLIVHQVGGISDSVFRYSVPAGGAVHFQTDGSPASLNIGWARLIPDLFSPAPIGSGIFSYNPGPMLISESGIPSAVATTHARIYVDLSGDHNTGLAIANVTDSASSITVRAFQTDGATPAGTSRGPIQLAASGHDAEFADQFIPDLPAGFTGVLDISSSSPFAALTIRSLVNERDDFLMTTFPIADANAPAPSPIIFPQIVDGGGYRTQIFFISPNGASDAILRFWDETGAPLAIGE